MLRFLGAPARLRPRGQQVSHANTFGLSCGRPSTLPSAGTVIRFGAPCKMASATSRDCTGSVSKWATPRLSTWGGRSAKASKGNGHSPPRRVTPTTHCLLLHLHGASRATRSRPRTENVVKHIDNAKADRSHEAGTELRQWRRGPRVPHDAPLGVLQAQISRASFAPLAPAAGRKYR